MSAKSDVCSLTDRKGVCVTDTIEPTTATDGRPYHHGDLRHALIQAARAIVIRDGAQALSLRGVAREAGVSPAAPYHHFKDKQELVLAVGQLGFEELGVVMERGWMSGPSRKVLTSVRLLSSADSLALAIRPMASASPGRRV